MKTKQGSIFLNQVGRFLGFFPLLFLLLCQSAPVNADDLAMTAIDFVALSGEKLQIQLDMNEAAVQPKVFQTDNPARIALDFVGVTNALAKKMIPVNQGAVSTIYIAEAADRIRVVVNLLEATPFETKVEGNKVLLTLNRAKTIASANLKPVVAKPKMPVAKKNVNSVVATLIPEQVISGFDFKRGDKSEGRILIYLANPDTVVNSKQEGGKVVINLLNTRLPENLAKRLDVSEFATPIKFIDTIASKQETTVTVTTQNELYDYSLFQSEGLLTIEFRPLSIEEKDAIDRVRVKYKGDRLSLNFQDIEIRSVIAILAEFTGQNIVAGDDVTGNITLKLDDVPWDEALDFIMMTKDLEKFESGTVTMIAPAGRIKKYKEMQEETMSIIEQLDPLVTRYFKINYAKAENFRNLLNGQDTGAFGACGVTQSTGNTGSTTNVQGQAQGQMQSTGQGQVNAEISGSGNQTRTFSRAMMSKDDQFALLSYRGSAVVDSRTNTLIIRETTKRMIDIIELIKKLDKPVQQVMIESRVVIASDNLTRNLGVKFGVAKGGSATGTSFAMGGTGTQGTVAGGTPTDPNALLVDLPASLIGTTPPGALGMTLARAADYVLNLELQALQAEGKAELLSNPRVMTMDRCTAVMTQGVQIPVTTPASANNPPTTTYKPAVLELNVTPQITPSGSVVMDLLVKKDSQSTTTNAVSGNPAIDTRQVKTSVLVGDGETVVLGGVYENTDTTAKNKIPFFADLPGIGFLFTNSSVTSVNNELLIFVTPKIMTDKAENN